jgi:VanZ family protein
MQAAHTISPSYSRPKPWKGALWAYGLLLVYASLYPFSNWQGFDSSRLALALWPRFYSHADIAFNFCAYLPFGAILCALWNRRDGAGQRILMTSASAFLLSAALETCQFFLVSRVPSTIDLTANTLGALSGALIIVSPLGQHWLRRAAQWRRRSVLEDHCADIGLMLMLGWLLAQTNPAIPFFEAGNMINQFTQSWKANPYDPLYLLPQGIGVALNVCGFALFVSVLLKPGRVIIVYVLGLMLTGLLLKLSAGAFMLRASASTEWLSPASVSGLLAGLIAAVYLLRLQFRTRLFVATLLVFAGGLMSKLSSIYDPIEATLRLFNWQYGQLSNFTSLTRYLHEIWPLLALLFLAYCFIGRRLYSEQTS